MFIFHLCFLKSFLNTFHVFQQVLFLTLSPIFQLEIVQCWITMKQVTHLVNFSENFEMWHFISYGFTSFKMCSYWISVSKSSIKHLLSVCLLKCWNVKDAKMIEESSSEVCRHHLTESAKKTFSFLINFLQRKQWGSEYPSSLFYTEECMV